MRWTSSLKASRGFSGSVSSASGRSPRSPFTKRILDECRARNLDLPLVDFSGVENQKVTLAERFRLGVSAMGLAGKLRRIAAIGPPNLMDA